MVVSRVSYYIPYFWHHCYDLAYKTPTIYSDDIFSPFEDIGMGDWGDDQIKAFFKGKQVIDIGSGFEGVARRLYRIFGNVPNAPTVVNLNPQFTDWRMTEEYINGKRKSVKISKQSDIEACIHEIMDENGEDFEGYMERRIAVAGIVQKLDFPDRHFDVQISTWAFPNLLFDVGGDQEYAEAGYKEILRTQHVGGLALLAPIRAHEEKTVSNSLRSIKVPHTATFSSVTGKGHVLTLRAAT